MMAHEFAAWRKRMRYSKIRAGEALGLGRMTISHYEQGFRHDDKRPVEIPVAVELACQMLEHDRSRETLRARRVAKGYQVMIDGRERDLSGLSRNEAIMALKTMIDSFEDVDERVKEASSALDSWRSGRTKLRRT